MTKLFILFLMLYGCETPAGFPGASKDIRESIKRGVFIKEYTTYPNPYKINDTLQITVKQAWIEVKWAFGKEESQTILYPEVKYQLCINTNKNDIEGNAVKWTIGVDFDKNLRASDESSLIGDFNYLPGDTIEFKVQKGNELSDNYQKTIIGNLLLIKKQGE